MGFSLAMLVLAAAVPAQAPTSISPVLVPDAKSFAYCSGAAWRVSSQEAVDSPGQKLALSKMALWNAKLATAEPDFFKQRDISVAAHDAVEKEAHARLDKIPGKHNWADVVLQWRLMLADCDKFAASLTPQEKVQ